MALTDDAAERVTRRLRHRVGTDLVGAERQVPDTLQVDLSRSGLLAATRTVVDDLGGRFLISMGTDLRPLSGGYGVCHIFSLDAAHLYVVLKCEADAEDPRVDSICGVVPGADWSERECYDAVGVRAEGHPDPRRLMLADDWPEGVFPLRRDFRWDDKPPPAEGARPKLREPPPGSSVIPLGPFFPVLEEPAHFRLFVEGETIVGCDYRGFYNHRGIEKMADSTLTYNEIPYIAERICGICGFIHSTCYCQAVEKAAEIEVPRRARFIRTIMLELERVHSHLLWLGIAGHILGFDTVLMQAWRMREPVMWLCEEISGNRKTYGMNTVGGVRRDIPERLRPGLRSLLDNVEREVLAVRAAVVDDGTLHARTRGVGVLGGDHARAICTVGPTARGSGVAIDARIDHPYAAYDEVRARIAVQAAGDTWARTLVRIEETLESLRILREAETRLPEGEICGRVQGDVAPGWIGVSTVEAPRGEAVHVVLTGGDNRPYRWRVRAPTYPNLQAVPKMVEQQTIADVPIIVGSLDPCFSCTERVEVVDRSSGAVRVYRQQELVQMFRERGAP